MRELALFAGAGGGILGGHLLGWKCVCAVEIEDYPRRVLLARQRDGILPRFPIWDDIRTFDGTAWRGRVDIVTGGFPCQDISAAGKGAGITGERSGLWSEMARVIREVQPRFVLVENSSMLTVRGLGVVLGDLAALGYDARWGVLGADDAGLQHQRKRIWILAYTSKVGDYINVGVSRANNNPQREAKIWSQNRIELSMAPGEMAYSQWSCKGRGIDPRPGLIRNTNGLAYNMDRLAAIGNGQVPAVVCLAWRILSGNGKIDIV